MYARLDAWLPVEGEVINELGLRHAGTAALTDSSSPVLDWIANEGITISRSISILMSSTR
jgi:hypothetical protein